MKNFHNIKTDKFEVINPYTNEIVDKVAITTSTQLRKALELSYNYKCELSSADKSLILKRSVETIQKDKEEIAFLITAESGLSIKHSLHEVERAINCLNYSIIESERICNKNLTNEYLIDSDPSLPKLNVVAEPMDLTIAITPFNHPLNLVIHKVAPSIVSGSAMVLKPSEKTPLTALKLGDILFDSGLPLNHNFF